MADKDPLVSVVIPTRNRPALLLEAVASALRQTLAAIEVIVIVDGPDPATGALLRNLADPRLRILELLENGGPAGARNAGVRAARSSWIAFLDDDDLWLPNKLELQLKTAHSISSVNLIVACRVLARNSAGDHIWPRRFPAPGENLSEYLFCRKTPFAGEGLMQPSMLFVSRDLLLKAPFRDELVHLEDYEWLLRVHTLEQARIVFTPTAEPLAIWRIEDTRSRLSYTADWTNFAWWAGEYRDLLTPRAYSSFVLTWAGLKAARGRHWEAFGLLLREAFARGRPRLNDLLSYFAYWAVPEKMGFYLALSFARLHHRFERRFSGGGP